MTYENFSEISCKGKNHFSDVLSLYKKNAKSFYVRLSEYKCQENENWRKFANVIVSYVDAEECIYVVLFFDLKEEKVVLALVHDDKKLNDQKLAEISAFASTSKTPNGITAPREYLVNGYSMSLLEENRIVFCKQYKFDEIETQDFSEQFDVENCRTVFWLQNQIVKSQNKC